VMRSNSSSIPWGLRGFSNPSCLKKTPRRLAPYSAGASFLMGFERDWVVLGEGRIETPLTELDEQVRGGVDSLLWQNSKEDPIVAETAS
jgi:hypothetical protein